MKTITEMTKLEILNHLVQLETMYQAVDGTKLLDNWTENYLDDRISLEAELINRTHQGNKIVNGFLDYNINATREDVDGTEEAKSALLSSLHDLFDTIRCNPDITSTI